MWSDLFFSYRGLSASPVKSGKPPSYYAHEGTRFSKRSHPTWLDNPLETHKGDGSNCHEYHRRDGGGVLLDPYTFDLVPNQGCDDRQADKGGDGHESEDAQH